MQDSVSAVVNKLMVKDKKSKKEKKIKKEKTKVIEEIFEVEDDNDAKSDFSASFYGPVYTDRSVD
jgi:hypothetical protein